jgi:hypothetical protein
MREPKIDENIIEPPAYIYYGRTDWMPRPVHDVAKSMWGLHNGLWFADMVAGSLVSVGPYPSPRTEFLQLDYSWQPTQIELQYKGGFLRAARTSYTNGITLGSNIFDAGTADFVQRWDVSDKRVKKVTFWAYDEALSSGAITQVELEYMPRNPNLPGSYVTNTLYMDPKADFKTVLPSRPPVAQFVTDPTYSFRGFWGQIIDFKNDALGRIGTIWGYDGAQYRA